MAVLGRLLIGSQQRIDLPDLLSLQSYVASDFKELIRSFIGDRALILKGFEIIDAPQAIGSTSVSIKVSNSVLYNPASSAGSFFYGLPEGSELSEPLVPELRTNATNYVYVTLSTVGAGEDTRAFWDVDLNGGEGGEFNQNVDTEAVLVAQVGVSTTGFPDGSVPVAIVGYDSSSITSITDSRNLMFRLGTGGVSPNPNEKFTFPPLPSEDFARNEPPSTINNSSSDSPFFGGDKNIQTLKDWMDAVMTKLLELSGTTYWYEGTQAVNLINTFDDALASSVKSKGQWKHDETTPGLVKWTEDLVYRKLNDSREVIIRQNPTTGSQLANEQVMWIEMVRGKTINDLDRAVWFTNGATYINAQEAGNFSNIKKGDWVKRQIDDENKYVRVIGFASLLGGAGSVATPEDALSVIIEEAYSGTSGLDIAVYTQGVYENSDIKVTDRDSASSYSSGGNFYWLANRSDTIMKILSIASTFTSGVNVSEANGKRAKLTFPSAHNLVDGDRIVITNGSSYNGTYKVEVQSSTIVNIESTNTTTQSNITVSWALATTQSRSIGSQGFQVESSSHGFENNQTVIIADTSSTYDTYNSGKYLINVRSSTTFQIPFNANLNIGSVGTATCAKVIMKTELGAIEVVQGESIDINQPDSANIMQYTGMKSLAQTYPDYLLPDTYNTLAGFANFNADVNDNLTTRAAKLTAMMADRVQDRGITISGRTTFRNTGSGVLSISGDSLTISKPGSSSQTVNFSSSYTLSTNQALVIDITRDGSSAISPSVVSFTSAYLIQENRFILFFRDSTTNIYSWNGTKILASSSWTCNDHETSQNRNIVVNEQVSANYDGTKLVFSSTTGYVYLLMPGSSVYNRIDVANFTSGLVISNDESAWVRINRRVNKTFTNRQTSATYVDSDAAGSIYVTSTSSVPTDQDVFVIYSIQSNALIRHHTAPTARRSIYEEYFTVSGNQSSPYVITLPLDTRNNNLQPYYVSGSGQLEIALNGQILKVNTDYTEPGLYGSPQASITITLTEGLIDGDVIRFRLASEGGFYTVDAGTTTTLQQAYAQGRTVNITDGSPVVINSGVGYTALQVGGDLTVEDNLYVNGSQTITANNSSHALKITQAGTGNALVVEDATSDTTPFVIDTSGRLLLGDSISRTIANVTTSRLQISSENSEGFAAGLSAISWDADTSSSLLAAPVISLSRSASDTTGTNTLLVSNNALGSISFNGADGSTFVRSANIASFVDGTASLNSMPGRLVFSTTPSGSATPSERMRITNAGLVGIGSTSPASLLSVGSSNQFQVNSSGNIVKLNNVTYSWPSTQGGTNNVLSNNGSGTLTWVAPSSFSPWLTSGSDIYFSTGDVGIGTTTPTARLNVVDATSQDALRITQTGTGNALLVEDTTNPDTTPFVIDGNGCVVIGATAASSSVESSNYSLQQIGISAATTGHLQLNSSPNAASAGGVYQARSRSGAIVVDGDRLGQWQNYGYDGTSYIPAARILAEVDGTPGTNDMPGRITFSTTADGASAVTERLRIDSAGNINAKTSVGATIPLIKGVTIEDVVTVEPTLDIDFSSPSGIPGSLTFARNLAAKYYDGKTTAKAEENLVKYSQEFDNGAWNKSNTTVTANSTTAPDGTTTADLLTETTATSTHSVANLSTNYVTFQNGQSYGFSIFAKKGPGATAPNIIQLSFSGNGFGTNVYVNYNLSTGAVTASGVGVSSSSITSLGSGWYRCSFIANATSLATGTLSVYFVNNNSTATRAPSYTGVTTSNVYLWGAQLEQRSSITDYVVTTSQPVQNYMPILVDAPVDTPRIDFDPITLEVKGLLIEEQRANLLAYSEDFSNAVWTKTNCSVSSNVVVAPGGTLTADRLIENTTTNVDHYVRQLFSATSGITYTISFYAKAGQRTRIAAMASNLNSVFTTSTAIFNLSNGTITKQDAGFVANSGSIVNVGNGWYRCSISATAAATDSGYIDIALADTDTTTTYTGDGYSGVYVWGAQIEAGAFATSYIATTATVPAIRPADQASLTGTNFSDWYRQDQGTIYASSRRFAAVDFAQIVSFTDGTINNVIALGHGSAANPLRLDVSYANVSQASITAVATPSLNTVYNLIGSYNINNMTVSANGSTVSTDTAAIVPTVNRVNIGSYITNVYYFNGHIRRVIYWPEQLSNETMRTISAITL